MTTPAPAPAPAPVPAPAPAPAPTPAPEAWHGLPATDTAGLEYVKNKGWSSPADIIKSYQGAEKLIGRDPSTLVQLPKADDAAGFLGLMDKFGRPQDPAKYEFAKPEGAALDEGYVKWARGAFHQLGLTAAQVKQLSAAHNQYIKGVFEQKTKDYTLSVETDKKALIAEWRDGHERKINAAKSAANALGFSGEMIDAIEQAVGYANTWRFFADLGQKMGEDGFVSRNGDKGGFGGVTPAEAKAEWEKLQTDAAWLAAAKDPMHPNHESAKKKQTDLFRIMHPA